MKTPATDRRRRELLILAAVLLFFVVVAVFTPQNSLSNDWRASSRSAGARGARMVYELGERLGWRVQRTVADSIVPNASTVAVVLAPVVPFRAQEVHALLEGVRRGGALLYALRDESLNDSLHVQVGTPGYEVREDSLETVAAECPVPAAFSDRIITSFQGRQLLLATVRDSGASRETVDTLLRVHASRAERDRTTNQLPAAIGFPLGKGRVVVVGDVDLFRNDNVRVCAWDAAVQVVRLYEYLRDMPGGPPRTTLTFDEYHQGYGARPGTTRAVVSYLRGTPSGKALAHLGLAGAILLLALGPRTLSPRDSERVERRSPLEHVDALARAYWHVHATRTATRRLLRGLRRRTEQRLGSTRRDVPDEALLQWMEERIPERRVDIALVRQALTAPMPRKELPRIGDALRRLEHDILTSRS